MTSRSFASMGRALVLLAAAAGGTATAQRAPVASVSVRPEVPAAKTYFEIALTAEGVRSVEPPSLPEVEGLRIVSGPNVQRGIQSGPGGTVVSVTFSWRASVAEPGEYVIPAIDLVAEGKTLRTAPATFRARAPGSQDPVTDPAVLREKYKDSLFVTADVSTSSPYVGQPVVLTFRLWVTGLSVTYNGLDAPPISGFLQEKLGDERRYRRAGQGGGKVFTIVERSVLLIPIEPGERSIAPVEASVEVRVQRDGGRRRSVFGDSLFGDDPFDIFANVDADTVPLVIRSEPLTLNVKPLPEEGRPARFGGAVGDFEMRANVSHREIAAGDPVTVTVELRGRGNFRNMGRPGFEKPLDGFREYEPERKENVEATEQGLFGTVIYTQAIVPETAGATEIPAVEFPYFDVATGRFETLRSGPFPLTVTASAGPARPRVSERSSEVSRGSEIRVLAEDVLPLVAPPADFRRREPLPFLALAAAALLPLASLAATALVVRRRERHRLDPRSRRREIALKTAERVLRESSGADAAARAISGFVADRLSLPAASITPAEVPRVLAGRATEPLAEETRAFLEECDRRRFAPSGASGAPDDLRPRAEALLAKLRGALR